MSTDQRNVVIDNGTGMIKAGFSGDSKPRIIFPTLVGRPKPNVTLQGADVKQIYVGNEAQGKRGVLNLAHPIQHGVISDWQDMTKVWHHCFYNELRVDPKEYNMLLTEAPRTTGKSREQMCSIMFEEFEVQGFFVQIQAVLALYSSGRTTGIVLDSGDGVTYSVPIFEGYALPHSIGRIDLAGQDLTDYLQQCLKEQKTYSDWGKQQKDDTGAQVNIIKDIKEKLCYVTADYDSELTKYENNPDLYKEYKLPDGQVIKIGFPLFKCPELLFRPELNGKEMASIHQLLNQSIIKCDIDIRTDLYGNVVLSGGSTKFKYYEIRLEKMLQDLAPQGKKVKISAPEDRKYSVYIGGSVLSNLPQFKSMWITKGDFDESGPVVANKRCM